MVDRNGFQTPDAATHHHGLASEDSEAPDSVITPAMRQMIEEFEDYI
jgi:hypothetical protein